MHLRSALLPALLPVSGLAKPLDQPAANQSIVQGENYARCRSGHKSSDFKPFDVEAANIIRVRGYWEPEEEHLCVDTYALSGFPQISHCEGTFEDQGEIFCSAAVFAVVKGSLGFHIVKVQESPEIDDLFVHIMGKFFTKSIDIDKDILRLPHDSADSSYTTLPWLEEGPYTEGQTVTPELGPVKSSQAANPIVSPTAVFNGPGEAGGVATE